MFTMDVRCLISVVLVLWQPISGSDLSRDQRFIVDSDPISCNFESSSVCGYTQDAADGFDWTRKSGSTTSAKTGPTSDHTLRYSTHGHYMYIETSSPRAAGDAARLISRSGHTDGGRYSVGFYYSMYGSSVGSLNVYVDKGQGAHYPSFSSKGNQGTSWLYGCVDVSSYATFKIIFEGTVGISFLGDIAIDDVKLQTGTCSSVGTTPPSGFHVTTTTGALSLSSLSCNFDHNMCRYTQDNTDARNWQRHTGNTTSLATGPGHDHTLPLGHGFYVYMESSSPVQPGDKARLLSPTVTPSIGYHSVTFWYHMYGKTMGTLNVYIKTGSSLGSPRFHVSGDQGSVWRQGCVEIPNGIGAFRLVFEGIIGPSYHSDIAIDDITVSTRHCAGTTQSTTDPSIINVTIDIKPLSNSSLTTNHMYTTSPLPLVTNLHTGHWSTWSSYSACSRTCGTSYRFSSRHCTGGSVCYGQKTRTLPCHGPSCTTTSTTAPRVDGAWSGWNTWSQCSTSCGMGAIVRTRMCSQPAPSGGGSDCSGDTTEKHDCSAGPCPVWSHWYNGPCSTTCSNGTMELVRHCSTGHDEDCTGSPFQLVPCSNPICI